MSDPYDLAILGAGCAGLSLARELIRHGYSKRAVILEPREVYTPDRTWCFWASGQHELSDLVSKRWSHWQLSTLRQTVDHRGSGFSYQQIRSDDFYQAHLAKVARRSNIKLRQGVTAGQISDQDDHVLIETTAGAISARRVIDTRPRSPEHDQATLWQIFSGAEVETDEACFDPSVAGLMQQMTSDESGLKFTYILPMTAHAALIQTTRFALRKTAPETLDREFERDLRTSFKTKTKIRRRERGCLPMGQTRQNPHPSDRVLRAGQAAGVLRASSGYGFLRIQAWAESTAEELASDQRLLAKPYGSPLERKMDAIFLAAMTRSPHAAADWFACIADQLSGDEFGRFMSQSPSLHLWLKVVSSLPKAPFVRALLAGMPEIDRADHQVAT